VIKILSQVSDFSLTVLEHPLVFVLDLGQLSIFIKIITLQFVNFGVVFLTLLLEELKLLFKSLVSRTFNHFNPLFLVLVLLLEAINDLLLHVELVLDLSQLLIVPLLQFCEIFSQHVDLFIFLDEFIAHLELEFFLVLIDLPLSFVSLLAESCLELLFFTFVKVLELCQALFRSLLDLFDVLFTTRLLLFDLLFQLLDILLVFLLKLLNCDALRCLKLLDLAR